MAGVGGVVLAAGRSTRLDAEFPKQLLAVDSEPMARRVVRAALGSRLAEVVVVLGHRAADVGSVLAGLGVRTVENPDHADGQSTSVRAGLAALSPSMAAAMFLPADQPLLTSSTIDRLIAAWEASPDAIVVPARGGRRGSPVLFGRELFSELEALRGDVGGRALLPRHEDRIVTVEVDAAELDDVDTVEDLQRMRDEMPEAPNPPTLAPEDFYFDQDGLMVFTREYHLKRGFCCESGCRHCPWGYSKGGKRSGG